MKRWREMALCSAVIGMIAGTTWAVSIETVPVGSPGNPADSNGEGSVGYAYSIGMYEVTVGQYCEFLNKVAATDTYGLYSPGMWSSYNGYCIQRNGSAGSYTYNVGPGMANYPVTSVSFWDACRFVNWLQNGQPTGRQVAGTTETGTYTLNGYNDRGGGSIQRNTGSTWALISGDEWYKAAYYNAVDGSYYLYPTSSNNIPGTDMSDRYGNNARYYGWLTPVEVGHFRNSPSPYGTFDQGGNAYEWTETTMNPIPTYSYRALRGGSFGSGPAQLSSAWRTWDSPDFEAGDRGFRVTLLPEPVSISMLLLGGIALTRSKRQECGRP